MAEKNIDVRFRFIDDFTKGFDKTMRRLVSGTRSGTTAWKGVEKAGKKISGLGNDLTKGITMPVLGIVTASVKVAAGFESAMSQVGATMGKTSNQLSDLSDLAKEMGRTTKFTSTEAAEGINILAQAGLTESEIIASLPDVLNLATAGNIQMGESATYTVAAFKGFGDSAENVAKYTDLIAKGATLANTSVPEMGTALSGVAATAKSYGQEVESTTLSLLRLANGNVTGAEASTGLSAAMTRVFAPTEQAKKAMDKLNVSAYDLKTGAARNFNDVVDDISKALQGMTKEEANAAAKTIFGTNRIGIYNKMVSASQKELKKFTKGIDKASGATSAMAKEQSNNLLGQLTLLKSALEAIGQRIGDAFLPYLKKGVEFAQNLADKINGLSDEQIDLIIKIGLMVAAVGPALSIFGKSVTVFGKAGGAINKLIGAVIIAKKETKGLSTLGAIGKVFVGGLASPAAIVVGALAGIVAATVLVVKNWGKLKVWANKIAEVLGSKLAPLGELFKDIFSSIGTVFKKNADNILSGIKKIQKHWDKLSVVVRPAGKVFVDVLRFIADFIAQIFVVSVGVIGGILQICVDVVMMIVNRIVNIFDGLILFLTGVFTGNWSKAWSGVTKIFENLFGGLGDFAKSVLNGIITIVNSCISAVNSIHVDIPEWVPGIGGKNFSPNIPKMPALAQGTENWKGGLVQINERGGEIVDLPKGSRVYPHDESVNMARKSGGIIINIPKLAEQIVIREDSDIDRIVDLLVRKLTLQLANIGEA